MRFRAFALGLMLALTSAACSQIDEHDLDSGADAPLQEGPPRPSVPGFSTLVMSFEFDDPLDTNVWLVRTDSEGPTRYQKQRVSVSNGVLALEGKPRPFRINQYVGGALAAKNTWIGPDRLVEYRVRMTGAAKWNLAGWTFGGDPWPKHGEIDTIELLSRGKGRAFPLQSLHGPARGMIANNNGKAELELDGTVWRTYAHIWQGDTVTFYIDGKESFRRQITNATDLASFKRFYPAISFYSGGWIGNAQGPARGYVDYLRVWAP
jgi:beta-glucanase (GH16 family)